MMAIGNADTNTLPSEPPRVAASSMVLRLMPRGSGPPRTELDSVTTAVPVSDIVRGIRHPKAVHPTTRQALGIAEQIADLRARPEVMRRLP
jgi:hypothetical protein